MNESIKLENNMIFAIAQSFYERGSNDSIRVYAAISTHEAVSEEEAIGQFVKYWHEKMPERHSIGIPALINVTEQHNLSDSPPTYAALRGGGILLRSDKEE